MANQKSKDILDFKPSGFREPSAHASYRDFAVRHFTSTCNLTFETLFLFSPILDTRGPWQMYATRSGTLRNGVAASGVRSV